MPPVFITSERAILGAAEKIHAAFGLRILSLDKFSEKVLPNEEIVGSVLSPFDGASVEILPYSEEFRKEMTKHLISLGLELEYVRGTLANGFPDSARRRFEIRRASGVFGYCCWNLSSKLQRHCDARLLIDKAHSETEMIIDHLIEKIIQDSCRNQGTPWNWQFWGIKLFLKALQFLRGLNVRTPIQLPIHSHICGKLR